MNYAQEGLEANEVDNSLTLTNAAPEYIVAQQKELQQQLAELEVQQKAATKTIIEQQNTITNLQNKLAAERQELSAWLDPLAEMLAGRIVASAAFETAIDAVMENISDSSHFTRIIEDIVEDKISNLDFEVRVR